MARDDGSGRATRGTDILGRINCLRSSLFVKTTLSEHDSTSPLCRTAIELLTTSCATSRRSSVTTPSTPFQLFRGTAGSRRGCTGSSKRVLHYEILQSANWRVLQILIAIPLTIPPCFVRYSG
jgi:hypothetical protein